jgi:hypothetical protein
MNVDTAGLAARATKNVETNLDTARSKSLLKKAPAESRRQPGLAAPQGEIDDAK